MKKVFFALSIILFSITACTKEPIRELATKSLYVTQSDFQKITFEGSKTTFVYGLDVYTTNAQSITDGVKSRVTLGKSFMIDVFKLDIQSAREF